MSRPKGFLRRFGRKTGMDFAHFSLELGVALQECMNVFVVSIPNESERKSNKQIQNEC